MAHLPLLVLLAAIAPRSGEPMCALTPADFEAVGVAGTTPQRSRVKNDGSIAYCVYAGRSLVAGGVELDVFYPAGVNAAEAKATYDIVLADVGAPYHVVKLAGADEARWAPSAVSVSGGARFATIAVRRGTLVFVIGFPPGKSAQTQLTKLAELVLKRF